MMMENCINPNEIQEGDLLAYAEDADAEPQRVREHVARCPACAAQVEALRETDCVLRAVFTHDLCPTPDALLSYVLDMLPPEDRYQIARHLVACPRCAADVQALQEAGEDAAASAPADAVPELNLWQQVARFARALVEAVSVAPRPALLPALRGVPYPMQLFRASDLDIALLSKVSASTLDEVSDRHPPLSTLGKVSDRHPPPSSTLDEVSDRHPFHLRGRIMQRGTPAPQAVGHPVHLLQGDRVITTQTVDDLGYFVFDHIPPGTYDVLLEGTDTDIVIRHILVGNHETLP
jgi:hypothetical protein